HSNILNETRLLMVFGVQSFQFAHVLSFAFGRPFLEASISPASCFGSRVLCSPELMGPNYSYRSQNAKSHQSAWQLPFDGFHRANVFPLLLSMVIFTHCSIYAAAIYLDVTFFVLTRVLKKTG